MSKLPIFNVLLVWGISSQNSSQNFSIELGSSGVSNDYGRSLSPPGTKFSTIDRDNDIQAAYNCAQKFSGAWWHTACHESNINGLYLRGSHASYANGVNWYRFRGYQYSLKNTVMKVRATP